MKSQNNDSLFTEIKQVEAANVNGGYLGFAPDYSIEWGYYFDTYPNQSTYIPPTFNSLGDIDRSVNASLSNLFRWW